MLILASASPRRRQLLKRLTANFESVGVDIDESRRDTESAAQLCVRLARQKAQLGFARYGDRGVVLGGDTVVALGERVFGKPRDRGEAMEMLTRLSGTTHIVHSGIAVVSATAQHHRLSSSEVTFTDLSQWQIADYCQTDGPYDKAGGYAIQGEAGAWVTHLRGSYTGVMGLPLWETAVLLRQTSVII